MTPAKEELRVSILFAQQLNVHIKVRVIDLIGIGISLFNNLDVEVKEALFAS